MGEQQPVARDFILEPGFVCAPLEPMRLSVVVASGVAVTLFDPKRKRGGMGHYIRPFRTEGRSTALFAAPSIVTLVRMLLKGGARPEELEAHLYGGAANPEADNFAHGVSEQNIQVGQEILDRMRIPLSGADTGGARARKVVFHTGTGETVVARVDRVRRSDWYPPLAAEEDRRP